MEQDYLDKRVQRSRSAIKQKFIELLQDKPFEQITISEIARETNYNRGTFYANFHSTEDLLKEIITETLNEMIIQIKYPYKSIKNVNIRKLPTADITLFKYFKDNSILYKLLLSDHIRVDFRHQMSKAIEDLFLAEYEYELPEDSELEPKWLYIYRANGIAGFIIRWIEEDFPTSPEYMAKQIVELMLVSTETFFLKE
ncbi:TetR/AcrR family transcriptional regulator [Cytobacillus horneckiae]|uniref:TetR/AcrR family transcriptional regulator n=1 Tax=Cytobacillus horneckiae TaxID=549687 RepID=UPI0034CE8692